MFADPDLRALTDRVTRDLTRDRTIQRTTDRLRDQFGVDRVVLYYFYCRWEGQVTFESLSAEEYSILGSTGPDDCFNDKYADMYLAGRVRAISDIEAEPIAECHRNFLRDLHVRANLVVPVLTERGLWGLLVAHHCRSTRLWRPEEILAMERGARELAATDPIRTS